MSCAYCSASQKKKKKKQQYPSIPLLPYFPSPIIPNTVSSVYVLYSYS